MHYCKKQGIFLNDAFSIMNIAIYKMEAYCVFMKEFYGLTLQKFVDNEKIDFVYCIDIACFQRLLVHAAHQRG